MTHQFSNGGRKTQTVYLSVISSSQFCINNNHATFLIVYVFPWHVREHQTILWSCPSPSSPPYSVYNFVYNSVDNTVDNSVYKSIPRVQSFLERDSISSRNIPSLPSVQKKKNMSTLSVQRITFLKIKNKGKAYFEPLFELVWEDQ